MKLIEADKVEQTIKDYWKAQVDKALTLTDGNEKRINIYLEHNHELLKAIDELPSAEQDTTTHDSIHAENGRNDGDGTSGDCISRQQAIYEIHEDADWLAAQGSDWQTERMERDKSILMSLPSAQPEQRWIPCSERLPEERGLYLTTTKNKEVYCDYWNEDNFDRTEMVIAWMPLPEPYQEGGEADE